MAVHTSLVFEGFRGSINRQLLFKQCGGKTIVTKFPDRSQVVYSENQQREQRRFADAVSFARIVIADKLLFQEYSLKASQLNFRSAWNAAIAEYMSKAPLERKPEKIPLDKSIIQDTMGNGISVKLYRLEYFWEQKHFKRWKMKGKNFRFLQQRQQQNAPPLPLAASYNSLSAVSEPYCRFLF